MISECAMVEASYPIPFPYRIAKSRPRSPTIVLAEEPSSLRNTLCGQLRKDGYHVITADDGLELVRLMTGWAATQLCQWVDLIIIAQWLPKLDGLSVAVELRQHQIEIPIVLLRTDNDRETLAQVAWLGIEDVFARPIAMTHLRRTVARLVTAKRRPIRRPALDRFHRE